MTKDEAASLNAKAHAVAKLIKALMDSRNVTPTANETIKRLVDVADTYSRAYHRDAEYM
jgi:hypothetical protein